MVVMQTLKEAVVRVKPCGCIVKEGGVVLLCPEHARAELKWSLDFDNHASQSVTACLSELMPYCGSDVFEVLTQLSTVAKMIMRERKANETLVETVARILKASKYAKSPDRLIV